MTELDKAYLAGFMDGEGCITVVLGNGHFQPSVGICNTYKEVLLKIQKIFGGVFEQQKKVPGWKTLYNLYWTGPKGIALIKELLPYLVVKQLQGQIFVDFPLVGTGKKVTQEEALLRAIIFNKLKDLNKRGTEA